MSELRPPTLQYLQVKSCFRSSQNEEEILSNCDSMTFDTDESRDQSTETKIMEWFQKNGIKMADPQSII